MKKVIANEQEETMHMNSSKGAKTEKIKVMDDAGEYEMKLRTKQNTDQGAKERSDMRVPIVENYNKNRNEVTWKQMMIGVLILLASMLLKWVQLGIDICVRAIEIAWRYPLCRNGHLPDMFNGAIISLNYGKVSDQNPSRIRQVSIKFLSEIRRVSVGFPLEFRHVDYSSGACQVHSGEPTHGRELLE